MDYQQVRSVAASNAPAESAPNCRYGVSAFDEEFLTELSVGLIVNFGTVPPANVPDDIEYVAMIRVRQDVERNERDHTVERFPTYTTFPTLDRLAELVAANPGRMWIVGNEPDRTIHQDDTEAYVYAEIYHEAYHLIKQLDPSAQVGTAALVGVTPGRRQYLDLVWENYRDRYGTSMPVDVWTFHDYIMAEVYPDGRWSHAGKALGTDLELAMLDAEGDTARCSQDDVYCMAEHDSVDAFEEQVVAMRTWMKEHGQQNKPLILTEFGVLYPYQLVNNNCALPDEYGRCFTPQRSADYMVEAYEYLENAMDPELGYAPDDNRLVQQWMWFSMPWPAPEAAWTPSLLADVDLNELTIVGKTHVDEIKKRPLYQNLFVTQEDGGLIQVPDTTEPTILSALVYNNGNTVIDAPVKVTFFSDQARRRPIGTATIPAEIAGCARREYSVSVVWDEALPPGLHPYWITVDPDDEINESTDLDNHAQGLLVVSGQAFFLPGMLN